MHNLPSDAWKFSVPRSAAGPPVPPPVRRLQDAETKQLLTTIVSGHSLEIFKKPLTMHSFEIAFFFLVYGGRQLYPPPLISPLMGQQKLFYLNIIRTCTQTRGD